jgi:hypothetical protein
MFARQSVLAGESNYEESYEMETFSAVLENR